MSYTDIADMHLRWTERCEKQGLMYQGIGSRTNTLVSIDGKNTHSFTNCSYLGFDTEPSMIEAAKQTLDEWGLHYCCARSRLTIEPIVALEESLSDWFSAPALTFPSVTSTHSSVLPMLSAGIFHCTRNSSASGNKRPKVRMIFDRFAHASMQVLKPILAKKASVETIAHNDLAALEVQIGKALSAGEIPIFCADSVYSMGGSAPLKELFALAEEYPLILYLDDAHGTSIFGPQGQGYVAEYLSGKPWPSYLWLTFSLAKGFGCNGGGVVCPSESARSAIKRFGQTFAFSGPIDFAMAGAALRGLELHRSPELLIRQRILRQKVRLVDELLFNDTSLPFSPIRMIPIGDEDRAIDLGIALREAGYYIPVVFHPVVPRGEAQLRLCVTVKHDDSVLREMCRTLKSMLNEQQAPFIPFSESKPCNTLPHS